MSTILSPPEDVVGRPILRHNAAGVSRNDANTRQEEHSMPSGCLSRRNFLTGAVGASAALALPLRVDGAQAVKKGTSIRLWIIKTYDEPHIKALAASDERR